MSKIKWTSLNRIVWALELDEISPIGRLVALFIVDKFSLVDDEIWDGADPEMVSDIDRAAKWIGCDPRHVIAGLRELGEVHGLRISVIRDNSVWFRLPEGRPESIKTDSKPGEKFERRISIYVISAGDKATKIGISVYPDVRIANLQAANPLIKLKIEFLAEGPAPVIRKIEREAHARLEVKALGNEWFSASVAEAISVVSELLKAAGL